MIYTWINEKKFVGQGRISKAIGNDRRWFCLKKRFTN